MKAPFTSLVKNLIGSGQDFEFYPTTDEIIAALARDIKRQTDKDYHHGGYKSVLDVGAGNGKVLLALREKAELIHLHAIEKSAILCEQLDPDILIVGTEFAEQSLLSKHVDVVFSNPPYSEFEAWAVKIIRQAASSLVYLVIPERWSRSVQIADAIKYREAEFHKVGEFDFLNAEDRSARAKVHLLRIRLRTERTRDGGNDDPFDRFFKEQFADLIGKFGPENDESPRIDRDSEFKDLVIGPSYIESLVSLYDQHIAKIQRNYALMAQMDAELLREFNVSPSSVMASLKTRLSGLRSDYWNELFNHLDTVTNRLTSGSRQRLLEIMSRHVHVDFTLSNIYAVMLWVIKNANLYIESQLIQTYDLMVDKCNVVMYKSNQRTWVDERWRYNSEPRQNSHFALDYRIVTHRLGGIDSNYGHRKLSDSAADFIGDLLTLARNLGFDCTTAHSDLSYSGRERWAPGEARQFYGIDKRGQEVTLMDVRAFKNRNLHLRLAPAFILALNVEHGRLKGWLRTREEAVEELREPAAAEYFYANKLLTHSNVPLLCASNVVAEETA